VSDPKARSHLVERAMEALGGAQTLLRSTMPAPPTAPPPPPRPPAAAPVVTPTDAPAPADAVSAVSLDTMRRAGLSVAPGGLERNRVSEEMSVVQHQVIRTLRSIPDSEGRCGRIILITSARPGEGKTFTALNLAASIAVGGGRKTVLVDVDGKRGSISELLGLADAPGIRTLAGDPKLPPASLPIPTELPQLAVVPFGLATSSGTELPAGSAMVAALQRLAAALPGHLFVLDSPPCLSTSDPSNLAPLVGQVVMVVQAERTQRDEVEAALDLVEACPTLQLVLNQARMTSSDTFGAYGAYDVYRPYGARPGD
jgi:receptor protein-tyrosine kinase